MGMDISGVNPVSETGSYFRNNCWWWRPLWSYCYHVAPNVIDEDTYVGGGYNDGTGLNDAASRALAVILKNKIANGHTKIWKEERDLYLEALPDENCGVCNNNNRGHKKKKDCYACDGKGTSPSWEKSYPFDVKNVNNFANFLIDSGGFEIW